MSSVENSPPRTGRGPITSILAVLGAVATLVVGGTGVASLVSQPAQDCSTRGHPRLVCAAGAVGLADLAALADRDRALEAAKADIAAKATAVAELEKRLGEAEGRAKDLDAALAAAKAATAEAERLKSEIARRDAKIAELSEKLASVAKKPETGAPAARPAPTPVPTPKPKP